MGIASSYLTCGLCYCAPDCNSCLLCGYYSSRGKHIPLSTNNRAFWYMASETDVNVKYRIYSPVQAVKDMKYGEQDAVLPNDVFFQYAVEDLETHTILLFVNKTHAVFKIVNGELHKVTAADSALRRTMTEAIERRMLCDTCSC